MQGENLNNADEENISSADNRTQVMVNTDLEVKNNEPVDHN